MQKPLHHALGHLRTIVPSLRHKVMPYATPDGEPWTSDYIDPDGREITLQGITHKKEGHRRRVIIVHGLGGDPNAAYVAQWTNVMWDAGFDILRLGLRGSDGRGGHFYHIGLTADVEHALETDFDQYDDHFVVGFSLGGHITLRCSTLGLPITACCAISPPIDLVPGVEFLDSPRAFVYREYVLRELVAMYESLEKNGADLPSSLAEVKKVRSIRQWDNLTIAPHYGYQNADDYYEQNAMKNRVGSINTPTYVLVSPHDPMISVDFVKPYLDQAPSCVTARYVDGGGHVFFPFQRDPQIAKEITDFFQDHL